MYRFAFRLCQVFAIPMLAWMSLVPTAHAQGPKPSGPQYIETTKWYSERPQGSKWIEIGGPFDTLDQAQARSLSWSKANPDILVTPRERRKPYFIYVPRPLTPRPKQELPSDSKTPTIGVDDAKRAEALEKERARLAKEVEELNRKKKENAEKLEEKNLPDAERFQLMADRLKLIVTRDELIESIVKLSEKYRKFEKERTVKKPVRPYNPPKGVVDPISPPAVQPRFVAPFQAYMVRNGRTVKFKAFPSVDKARSQARRYQNTLGATEVGVLDSNGKVVERVK